MTQKTNEQGQKVYEVLSEEYIRLKEMELANITANINTFVHWKGSDLVFQELKDKYKELSSHIEDLKAEM